MEKRLVDFSEEVQSELPEDKRGIKRLSIVSDPAIKVKGYFFKEQKKFISIDGAKMRLAAPVVMPMSIFREADEDDPNRDLVFDRKAVDDLFLHFMQNFTNKNIVNDDHTEEVVPAYILEIWQVEEPLKDKAYLQHGFTLPEGTIFAVIQFTDKEYFEKSVKEGKSGISIEAFFKEKEYKFKNQERMKKKLFKAHKFNVEGKASDEEVVIVADGELKEGDKVGVIDETGEKMDDFTGEVKTESGEVVSISEGTIENVEEKKDEEPEKKVFSKEGKKKRFNFSMEAEEGKTEEGEAVTVVANEDALTEGVPVVVINDSLEVDEAFTGVVVDGKEKVTIDGGVITAVEKTGTKDFENEEPPAPPAPPAENGITEEKVVELVKQGTDEVVKEVAKMIASAIGGEESDEEKQRNFSRQAPKKKVNLFEVGEHLKSK